MNRIQSPYKIGQQVKPASISKVESVDLMKAGKDISQAFTDIQKSMKNVPLILVSRINRGGMTSRKSVTTDQWNQIKNELMPEAKRIARSLKK